MEVDEFYHNLNDSLSISNSELKVNWKTYDIYGRITQQTSNQYPVYRLFDTVRDSNIDIIYSLRDITNNEQ